MSYVTHCAYFCYFISVNMSGIATGESCNTISMDISPSNQVLAFGDSLNEIYLYSSVSEPAMNPFARY